MAGITGKIDFNEKLILAELPVNGENNIEKHFEFAIAEMLITNCSFYLQAVHTRQAGRQ